MKRILIDDAARQSLKKGVDILAEVVGATLGPKGKSVVIRDVMGGAVTTLDGVTVAREVELEDEVENIGADLVRQAASKTNSVAGDGTTTATIIAQTIIEEGLRSVSAGASAVVLAKEIKDASDEAVKSLAKMSKAVKTEEELKSVATISCRDPELGKIIAETMWKVGNRGVVTVESSNTAETTSEVVEGLQLAAGMVSPYMVTDTERMKTEMENCLVVVTNERLLNAEQIVHVLEEMVAKKNKNLLLVANEIDQDALSVLILNRIKGGMNLLAVKTPGFGERREDFLEDIATVTGATIITKETGKSMKEFDASYFGSASKVIADKDTTVIMGGDGDKKLVETRIKTLENQIKEVDNDFDKSLLSERLAKLSGGVGVIKVGGLTEVEQKERAYRVEDAVNATKAAMEEGIVPGGGIALLNISKKVKNEVLKEALLKPFLQLCENGEEKTEAILTGIRVRKEFSCYDFSKGEYCNAFKEGIIDPTKVVRVALENAVSVATTLLNTRAVIVNKNKKDE